MKAIYAAILAATIPAAAIAQSAIDAQQISQSDFKGTARFMSMGGAFTALGGDLSTLNQNPAGIGIYRGSEAGVTLDINMQKTKTSPATAGFGSTYSQTKAYCNNFGYVGTIQLGSGTLRSFNWGVSFNRAQSFDRVYQGYVSNTQTSLSNYIAYFTQGTPQDDMIFGDGTDGYNPYLDSNVDWLSTLAYNSYLINPIGQDSYKGLYSQGNTIGDALYSVRETGRVDEYDISFGGNLENTVYWGVSVGITDLNYTRTIYYSESMEKASIYNPTNNGTCIGNAGFDLDSRKYINGNGWNIKAGVIIKPVNELRIGLAVHTPTWYNLNQGYDGVIDYSYYNPSVSEGSNNPLQGYSSTENAYFPWHFRSPWKLMAGIAGVIGGKAIISLDYQYEGFNNMSISVPEYTYDGFVSGYVQDDFKTGMIKDYFQGTSTVRLGLEYRVTPQFSIRAGYNVQTSNAKSATRNGQIEVLTTGTDCTYSLDKLTQNISFGIGYRYQNWYIDAAYVYRNHDSEFHAFANYNGISAPSSKLVDHNSSLVFTTGFKF